VGSRQRLGEALDVATTPDARRANPRHPRRRRADRGAVVTAPRWDSPPVHPPDDAGVEPPLPHGGVDLDVDVGAVLVHPLVGAGLRGDPLLGQVGLADGPRRAAPRVGLADQQEVRSVHLHSSPAEPVRVTATTDRHAVCRPPAVSLTAL
jgi:hypothetical protein